MNHSFYLDEHISNDLYHFGVQGMHWGVRKYQNRDGSLTDLGRRRRRLNDRVGSSTSTQKKTEQHKASSKADNETAKKDKKKSYSPDRNRPISEMTTQELRDAINRVAVEAEYREKVAPIEKTKLEKFKDSEIYQDVIKPAGLNFLKNTANAIADLPKTASKNFNKENERQEKAASEAALRKLREKLPDASKLTKDQLDKLNALLKAEDLYNKYVGRDPEVPRHQDKSSALLDDEEEPTKKRKSKALKNMHI